jgi:hypothetical protein
VLLCLTPFSTICQSIVLIEETAVLGDNHQPVISHMQTLSHNGLSSTPRTHDVSGDMY